MIGSDPAAGSAQPKGSTVTIIVGKQPAATGGTPTTGQSNPATPPQ